MRIRKINQWKPTCVPASVSKLHEADSVMIALQLSGLEILNYCNCSAAEKVEKYPIKNIPLILPETFGTQWKFKSIEILLIKLKTQFNYSN